MSPGPLLKVPPLVFSEVPQLSQRSGERTALSRRSQEDMMLRYMMKQANNESARNSLTDAQVTKVFREGF